MITRYFGRLWQNSMQLDHHFLIVNYVYFQIHNHLTGERSRHDLDLRYTSLVLKSARLKACLHDARFLDTTPNVVWNILQHLTKLQTVVRGTTAYTAP